MKQILLALVFICTSPLASAIPAKGHKLMMAGPSPYAAQVATTIAEKGGNVVDVAVAVGLTLAVTSPYFAGFGGGGFALVKIGKKPTEVLDFREVAPAEANKNFFKGLSAEASRTGGKAVGIPGGPAGLWELHRKYGQLHWSQLFYQPIRLAQKGFRVSGEWAHNTKKASQRFNPGGKKHFLKKGKTPYKPGELFKQRPLARVLKEMRNRNITSFYRGMVARDIVNSVRKAGGIITLKDMKSYRPRWLQPLTTDFKGYKIHLMPPPSSGGVVIKTALKLIDELNMPQYKALSVNELHTMGEILARAFRGRVLLGDPTFHKNPLEQLFSPKYIKKLVKSFDIDEVEELTPLTDHQLKKESTETTHFSVLDAKGNAVALTVTLNGSYGSAVVSNKYGIALNNEMDDFTTQSNKPNMFGLIQGQSNLVEPGKRPLSSMSPTLVEKNGKVIMSLGAPGGPRIISGVLQVLYRVLVSGYDMDQAIQAPRLHHQFSPKILFYDNKRLQPATIKGLKKRDHKLKATWIGRVYGVRVNKEGLLEAAYDSRGEGATGGL